MSEAKKRAQRAYAKRKAGNLFAVRLSDEERDKMKALLSSLNMDFKGWVRSKLGEAK